MIDAIKYLHGKHEFEIRNGKTIIACHIGNMVRIIKISYNVNSRRTQPLKLLNDTYTKSLMAYEKAQENAALHIDTYESVTGKRAKFKIPECDCGYCNIETTNKPTVHA